ncbi:transglutaminase family protein [Halovulum sp. GXIMD14794]
MRLLVEHDTNYHFETPRRRVVQSHRLTPVDSDSQRILDWSVTVEGASFGAAFVDGAGNRVITMTLPGPVETMTVSVRGLVETTDTSGILRGMREQMTPLAYLRETWATAPGVGLIELAEALEEDGCTLAAAHEMARLVAERIKYTPGATEHDNTAAEVVELGAGVCQDQAQVLIALARIKGMPARYVTGYMLSGGEDEANDRTEASHAWAELYVQDLGWVGFDAANECCPDERYIRVGSGLDAHDAAPIRGISLGDGEESMDIQVSVAAQQ